MQRPARSTAGITAPHFSQDESLYAKRQRVELQPCLLCDSMHRSDKERQKCRNSLVAQQKKARKEQEERQKAHVADERRAKRSRDEAEKTRRHESNIQNHCSQCGGTHR
jgi:hypothetical protein